MCGCHGYHHGDGPRCCDQPYPRRRRFFRTTEGQVGEREERDLLEQKVLRLEKEIEELKRNRPGA
jgi:hypothetical protein